MIPFDIPTEDDGHMYAIAYCSCLYDPSGRSVPATVGVYTTSAPGFARFSGHTFSEDGGFLHYHSGPDYSPSAEAALLDFWEAFKVPVYSWSLYPRELVSGFSAVSEETAYSAARQEFCRALYYPRGRAYAMHSLGAQPFFGVPEKGFQPVNSMAASAENEEIMAAVLAGEA